MISDDDLVTFILEYTTEEELRQKEDAILHYLKTCYESNPSEENDKLWIHYSNKILQRRCWKK